MWKLLAIAVLCLVFLGFCTFSGVSDRGVSADKVQARNDISQITSVLNSYYIEYGVMPKGNAVEIVAALRGRNPRQIVFWQPRPKSINARGEFVDPWGTPYRFGVSPDGVPWAYSCGRNRVDEGGAQGSDDVSSWQ